MKIRFYFAILALLAVITCFSSIASAKVLNVDTIIFDPATDGGRYFVIQDAQTMLQWRFHAGAYFDYAHQPIELRNVALGTRRAVVDGLVMGHFQFAMAFLDFLEGGFSIPVIMYEDYLDPNVVAITPREKHSGIGDIRFELKGKVLDNFRFPVGIALVPFVTAPTGNSTYFLGNGKTGIGGKIVVEGNILNTVWISMNWGYEWFNGKRQYFTGNADAVMDDLLLFGLGIHGRINDMWSLIAELNGETVANNAFKSRRQTPVAARGGASFTPRLPGHWRGLSFELAAGGGLTKGVGNPSFQIIGGINYRKPNIVALEEPKGASVDARLEEKIVITQKIHFEFNRSTIRPISYPILNDVVELLQRNPQMTRVEVEGHTDYVGGDAYNQRLSQKRAMAVVDYLVAHDIDRNRLVAVGYGESRPIASNETTEGRAKNRRTEFTVIGSTD